ncbi:T9SS type A sorting domain-containing protein [Candidatus Latescibacterota bacterium]
MKKLLTVITVLVLASSLVFAADFTPSAMKISVPGMINYGFDGSNLRIPVTVSGAVANSVFLVYTNGMGDGIRGVQNGHLGWHYVNTIDTCVYMSGATPLDIGSNEIIWDGKNDDGNAVEPGEYKYLIFGYDNQTPKQLATSIYTIGYSYANTVISTDENGNPLANPIMYMHNDEKWVIGSDPYDATLIETCVFGTNGTYYNGNAHHIALDPTDHNQMVLEGGDATNLYLTKYQWVPNGDAEVITSWGENGHSLLGPAPDKYLVLTGAHTDGETIWASSAFPFATSGESEVYAADMADGTLKQVIDLTDWYVSLADAEAGGQYHGGPDGMYFRNNKLFTQSLEGCMTLALNPYAEDEEDIVIWANDNGDYVHDHNAEEDSAKPWVCTDFNSGPYTYGVTVDSNNFNLYPAYDMGAVTFCLISGADGTGVGYFAVAGETAALKFTSHIVDEGTAWDGIYLDNNTASEAEDKVGTFYVASESINGIITNEVGVAEDAASFAVGQNSPNPFNPTTSISFTLADAGNVSIEVFNVAGQKIGTVANEFMSSGSHSVTWNASGFSAGIYFYTVKSGDFSRTMKMTLLK